MLTDRDNPEVCQTLLRRAGRGDTAAFGELYDRTAQTVFGLVRSVLSDAVQAEEVTLEVYLQAWRIASRFDPDCDDISTLLMTMALRRAVDRIRTAPARAGVSAHLEPTVSATNADIVERRNCAPLLAAVPSPSREVRVLTCFRGHTPAEVADLLGMREATAIFRLDDALASLHPRHRHDPVDGAVNAGESSRPRHREDTR